MYLRRDFDVLARGGIHSIVLLYSCPYTWVFNFIVNLGFFVWVPIISSIVLVVQGESTTACFWCAIYW